MSISPAIISPVLTKWFNATDLRDSAMSATARFASSLVSGLSLEDQTPDDFVMTMYTAKACFPNASFVGGTQANLVINNTCSRN
jgi:hypothetical protein